MHFHGIWSHFEAFRGGLNNFGSFSKKKNLCKIFLKRGADGLFGRKEGRGGLFLTGVKNTGYKDRSDSVVDKDS
jgi:hypothetical protein